MVRSVGSASSNACRRAAAVAEPEVDSVAGRDAAARPGDGVDQLERRHAGRRRSFRDGSGGDRATGHGEDGKGGEHMHQALHVHLTTPAAWIFPW